MIISLTLLVLAMVLVLGGILWLRLHPFLALVFSSLLVATLTPSSILQDYFIAMEGGLVRVEQGTGRFSDPPAAWLPGQAVAILEKKKRSLNLATNWSRESPSASGIHGRRWKSDMAPC